MKKIVSLAALLLCLIISGYGQQNIRGGNFEAWKYHPAGHFYQPDSSILTTLDTLYSVGSGITCNRCDTAHGGNYSAKLVTSYISSVQAIIPGVVGTLKINWLTSNAILGIPYPYGTTLPTRFSGYYQSFPISGDSSAAVVLLSKWNSSSHHRDTLAYNRLIFHGTVNTWTKFDTAVNYLDQSTIPDTITLLFLSCGGFNALHMLGSVGQIGSMALFDDVDLLGVNGFPLLLMPSVNVKIVPNPASQYIKVELNSEVQNGYFEIYDGQAKLVRQIPMSGNYKEINVNDLSAGTYYYKLIENSKLLNSGTFIVTK